MTLVGDVTSARRDDSAMPHPAIVPIGLLRYVLAASWMHQVPLVGLSIAVFLLEIVPLELQRRIVDDAVKHRHYRAIVLLCAAYAGALLIQGSAKLALNIYRAWVSERTTRDLRRRILLTGAVGDGFAQTRGTAVAMLVAEVEAVGGFIGGAISEPVLQAGILASVISYVVHIDLWMGVAALVLFLPQLVFVPLMQHAMNRRTGARVWLLRQIGAGVIAANPRTEALAAAEGARIDRVFHLNMRIFQLKFTMNFLMNLCNHLQIIAALLLGSWWVLQGELEIGGVVAFISGMGRLTDPWGDLINYYRGLSVTAVKFKLLTEAAGSPITGD